VHLNILSFWLEMVQKLAAVDFLTLLFLFEDLKLVVAVAGALLSSFPGLSSLILVEDSLPEGGLEQVVLMVVGAVVVVPVWLF
jgi:hypothetical protein